MSRRRMMGLYLGRDWERRAMSGKDAAWEYRVPGIGNRRGRPWWRTPGGCATWVVGLYLFLVFVPALSGTSVPWLGGLLSAAVGYALIGITLTLIYRARDRRKPKHATRPTRPVR